MIAKSYKVDDLDENGPVWKQLELLARQAPKALSRFCLAADAFETDPEICQYDRSAGMRVAPRSQAGVIEAYLVPALLDDVSALLVVDHTSRRMSFVKIYLQLKAPGEDTAQWAEIYTLAEEAILICRQGGFP